MNTATARQVSVSPPSLAAEASRVLRFSVAIALGAWLYLASSLDDVPAVRTLMPYQALVQDRPPAEQRVFRDLREGLLEAEAARGDTGRWPSPDVLAARFIPPFSPDPTSASTACRWALLQQDTIVNYLGRPERAGVAAWLVLIREPALGELPDQTSEDEEHHRLPDQTMLHVSIWTRAEGSTRTTPVRQPQAEGWTQIYAREP